MKPIFVIWLFIFFSFAQTMDFAILGAKVKADNRMHYIYGKPKDSDLEKLDYWIGENDTVFALQFENGESAEVKVQQHNRFQYTFSTQEEAKSVTLNRGISTIQLHADGKIIELQIRK